MSYSKKWRPNATQRREFAQRMQDPTAREEYEQRKREKAERRRKESKFDYYSAGGNYTPTESQNSWAFHFLRTDNLTPEQEEACNQVIYGYTCKEAVHHDYIHIVNELIRKS